MAATSNDPPLLAFARKGVVAKIEELFKNDPSIDINTCNDNGWTALHYASGGGHVQALEFLANKGADIALLEKTAGWNVLHIACYAGRLNVVEALLKHVMNEPSLAKEKRESFLNMSDKHGSTPLILGCLKGHEHIARALLEAEVDVTCKTSSGKTAADVTTSDAIRALVNTHTSPAGEAAPAPAAQESSDDDETVQAELSPLDIQSAANLQNNIETLQNSPGTPSAQSAEEAEAEAKRAQQRAAEQELIEYLKQGNWLLKHTKDGKGPVHRRFFRFHEGNLFWGKTADTTKWKTAFVYDVVVGLRPPKFTGNLEIFHNKNLWKMTSFAFKTSIGNIYLVAETMDMFRVWAGGSEIVLSHVTNQTYDLSKFK